MDNKCDFTNEAFNKIANMTYEKSKPLLFRHYFFL